ncbi:MAG TPA: hypothetical protein VL358_13650 [Caulobacteraceae bacterium]|jgi:hypothetical protein|nr:hypothetical protein [Caulobacteraceae bacterium]
MAETQDRSYRPIWWALVIIAFLALCAWTYVATQRSNTAVQRAEATGAGVGTAYNPATGAVVGAGATPGALGTNGPPPPVVAPQVVTPPAPGASGAAPSR